MYSESDITEARLRRVRGQLIRPNIWSPSTPLAASAWEVASRPDGRAGEPVDVSVAVAAEFAPVATGSPWGAPWGTTWFRFTATIPDEFAGRPVDAIIDLGFTGDGPGFQAEGLVWRVGPDGEWLPWRGLHPQNHTFRISDSAVAGDAVELLVEAASNPSFHGPNPNSDIVTAGSTPIYRLGRCAIALHNADLDALNHDYRTVWGWLRQLPANEPRHNDLLVAVEASLAALDPLDVVSTAGAAREPLLRVLSVPASPSAHRVSAIGHAHIDSAWLWPLRETVRKCARTFSNVLRLMDDEPEFKFGCSQAVQYEWMRRHYPSIFAGIKEAVARGQWIPIGGQWVEADGNITGGESHIRQLLHGQRYFREHFGVTCSEVWIPDVFGYPATLPQFFRLGGAERFLTQKLSWNRTNRFPHSTFWWEGIDGSRVYTHFPSVDTYNATLAPAELAFSVHNFKNHGSAHTSLMPFGFGDGGGGPSPAMIEQYHRSKDLEGSPRLVIESPEEFFDRAMEDDPEPPVWVGELYFEMHRGTYTSQARTKVGNRRSEVLLREAELWATVAALESPGYEYPSAQLDELWKTVLLHQFHDILPGTSIGWVHREAEETYAEVAERLERIIHGAVGELAAGVAGVSSVTAASESTGLANAVASGSGTTVVLANAAPFDFDSVVVIPQDNSGPDGAVSDPGFPDSRGLAVQKLSDGGSAIRASVPALSVGVCRALPVDNHVVATGRSMSNGIVSIVLDDDGSVTSLVHLPTGREAIVDGGRGSVWQLHHDLPLEYDAWDIENYYRDRVENLTNVESIELVDSGPALARLQVTRSFGSSRLIETFEQRAGSPRVDIHIELDWHERDHLLKVAWPVAVSTTEATRSIQYGHIRTPIHTNTSWDAARFELCAHHWIDVSETGFGVAMLNNGRYGHDVTRTRSDDGSPTTTMRLTVAKGSQFPDPQADLGRHEFTYSLMPHCGLGSLPDVIAEGYRLNMPVRVVDAPAGAEVMAASAGDSTGAAAEESPTVTTSVGPAVGAVAVTDPGVVVEVAKLAEDGSGDLVIRLWESLGATVTTTVRFGLPVETARLTDALEDGAPPTPAPVLEPLGERELRLSLAPFQIATIRVTLATP